jgi:hypothetical protein
MAKLMNIGCKLVVDRLKVMFLMTKSAADSEMAVRAYLPMRVLAGECSFCSVFVSYQSTD